MCTFGLFKRAHLTAPALQTPKFQVKTFLRREEKRENGTGEERKKRKFLAPHPSGSQPLGLLLFGPPHPSAPHFFWVGASSGLHPSADPSCENHHKHTHEKKNGQQDFSCFLSRLSIFIVSRCSPFCHFLCPDCIFYFVPTAVCFFCAVCVLFFCPGAFFFVLGPPCIVFTPQSDLLPTCLECTVFPNELTLDPPGRPQR